MKIPIFILTLSVSALLALQGWTLTTLVQQGQDIAAIKATLALRPTAQK